MLSCAGVCQTAQPFLAVLLQNIFTRRPFVIVVPDIKTQESCQQDLETWLAEMRSAQCGVRNKSDAPSSIRHTPSSLFYPPWEILPHEGKLPHADTISDRLQTLVTLSEKSACGHRPSAMVVTSITALLQKTFPPHEIQKRTRRLRRGDKINPLDLIEWLEEQGYEPEAQVTQKGEIALRGGILDVWPLTCPWPVRLEFFGDELESLREFDPLTQISREETVQAIIPPGGELGLLKKGRTASGERDEIGTPPDAANPVTRHTPHATLLDYLPRETIFLLCEPEQLAVRAEEYAGQIPDDDPFFIPWEKFLADLDQRGMTRLDASESEAVGVQASACPDTLKRELQHTPDWRSLVHGFPHLTRSGRWPNAPPNCRWPRRNAVNSSINSIAGCAGATRPMSSAITTANASGLRKSGRSLM